MATVSITQWYISLVGIEFDGSTTTALFNAMGSTTSGELEDESGILYVGETVTIDGVEYTYLGSGTASTTIILTTTVDVLVLTDADGNIYLVYPDGTLGTLSSATNITFVITETAYDLTNLTAVVCYAEGTRILTDRGEVAVEQINSGDRLIDHRGRAIPVVWRANMTCGMAASRFHPIEIAAEALGPGRPARTTYVSQQHRIALDAASLGIDSPDGIVMVAAKALINGTTIRVVNFDRTINYHHLLCHRHIACFAEGMMSETLLIGDMSLRALSGRDRQQIRDLSDGRLDLDADHVPGIATHTICPTLTRGDLRRAGHDPARGGRLLSPLYQL